MALETAATAEIHQSIRHNRDAYDRYEDFVSQNLCKLSYRLDRDSDFGIDSRVHSAEGFMVGRFITTAGRGDLIRTKAAIAEDRRGRYAIYMPVKGAQELRQFARSEMCGPGSIAMLSTAEPFLQRKYGDNDTIYFFMPRDFVDQRLLGAEDRCGRPIPISDGIVRLAAESITALQRDACQMNGAEFDHAAHVIGELVLLALGAPIASTGAARSVRTSNLARAKRIIRARLGDPDFKIGDIARECGISIRYLHDLFRAEGVTVSDYLKQQRLQRARNMLEDAGAATTVTDICFSCGFSNASQFSTAFRRAFSISPRDALRRAGYWGA